MNICMYTGCRGFGLAFVLNQYDTLIVYSMQLMQLMIVNYSIHDPKVNKLPLEKIF